MEDTDYMNEEEAQGEIDSTMMDANHPYHKSSLDPRHKGAVERMGKLYQVLYPEPEKDPEEPAKTTSPELVAVMKEGLMMRERKVRTLKEAEDGRMEELLQLADTGDLNQLTTELRTDLTSWGASERDLGMIDYFDEMIKQSDNAELRDWASEAVCWIYQTKKGEKR